MGFFPSLPCISKITNTFKYSLNIITSTELVKTITIKDDVYKKLVSQKGKDESFSDLFERLLEKDLHGGINALKKLKGSIEFDRDVKDKILSDIALKRSEHRT